MDYLWVGIGGFFGANSRYIVSRVIADRLGSAWPYGTFFVNLAGALIIGILVTTLTERVIADPFWRQLLVIGFLGGFTTFSSYTFDAMTLVHDGEWRASLLYVLGSNILGLFCCYLGIVIARAVWR